VKQAYPPAWCSRACKNALSDVCLEQCSVKRDGSWFDPHPVDIQDLPPFSAQVFVEELSPKQRTMYLGIYGEAIVNVMQGRVVTYERHPHRPRSRRSRGPRCTSCWNNGRSPISSWARNGK